MIDTRTRLLYGAGGAVYAVKEAAYAMFVLLFYTQVLGLDGTITGIIISVSLLWDALSDPLTGTLSDRLRSRYGRRHPFMVLSILPLGLGFLGLFAPPASVVDSTAALGGWLLFWSLWVRTFVTTFSIPHLALSTELTADYHERSQVLGVRMAFMFLFAVFLPAAGLLVIFAEEGGVDGRFVSANYPLYGALSCLVVWVMASISSFGTRRYARNPVSESDSATHPATPLSLLRDLLRTLENRNFRLLIGYEVATMMAYGAMVTLNMLVWTYVWEFSAVEVSIILSIPSLLAVILVILSLRPLGRHLHKCQQLHLAVAGLLLNCFWLYPLKLFGVLPANGTATVFALNFCFMLLFMYLFALRSVNTQSIVADIADEHELTHGVRQEAGFFSAINFINKLATIFGPVYAGIALDVIALPSGALPGELSQETLDALIYALGLGVIPLQFLSLLLVLRIAMRREQVEDIQAALRARREIRALAGP